jgi:hypothetical protein
MVATDNIPEDPDLAALRQTKSLAALAMTIFLVVAGLYLVDVLRANAAMQDCALASNVACLTLASGQ